jgi:hypothetical protein
MIVFYDCNDSGQYYKTVIVANFALARSVNYYRKVRCKLKRTLQFHLQTKAYHTIVIYDRKTCIVHTRF